MLLGMRDTEEARIKSGMPRKFKREFPRGYQGHWDWGILGDTMEIVEVLHGDTKEDI